MIKINLDKNKKYLLACSFGPDSMALFDLLLKEKYNFAVAHVNYGLREEAKKETEELIEYCNKNDIQVFVHYVKEEINKNIEELCREIRYSFFRNIIENYEFNEVLVAHNQDDSFETYLLQKKRKNIVELYGLNKYTKINGCIICRPLLKYSKKELLNYVIKNNVPFAIDKSNLEDIYERNVLRHNVVEKLNKEERKSLSQEIKINNKELIQNHKNIIRKSPKYIDDLLSFKDEELAYYFTHCARKYISNTELSLKQVKEFRNVMLSDKPNVIVNVKDIVYFVKSYDVAGIKVLPEDVNFCYVLNKPTKIDNEFFYLDFRKNSINRNVKKEDYPITIRNASKKDVMSIKDYHVSMRRQFINWKMPKELRNRWPIIVNNNNEIIYVPKYEKDFKHDLFTNFFVKI